MLEALITFLCLQEASSGAPPAPSPSDSELRPDPLQGTLSSKFRYRATPRESDSDLYQFLTLSYGNPERDPVTAALSARFAEDLDGRPAIHGFDPFVSLDDTYRSAWTQRLYAAYLEFRPRATGITLRTGRQILDEIPEAVPMDGAYLRLRTDSNVSLEVFGGLPVDLFESSPQGDGLYGASAEWVTDPALGGRYRVDYLHLRDQNIFGLHENDLLGFSLDEGLGPFRVHARYTMLGSESRDLVARLTGTFPETGLLVALQSTYVFRRIEALAYALDPYASFMMALEPYVETSLRASQSFGEFLSVDLMASSREFVRSGVETPYNHEYRRIQLAPQLRNWPLGDVSIGLSADYWDASGIWFWTLGGELSWAIHRQVVLGAGTGYALYSIDALTGEEHDRVRTYWLSLKWKLSPESSIDVRFTLEENAIDTFRILEVGFRHAF